ncbi:hypothetical protein MRB53_004699 [Persea americana]|uniref:Uncharacterized protein n=1 Tax=Persea americana TaxID=3435 RepID=A0ACC2MC41_PERAE|nr:hypothetical protein MRB53_004699 [Persea americana]
MATDDNSQEKCRAARRRRIEMRRLSAFAGATSPQPAGSIRTEKRHDRSGRTDEEKRSRTGSPSQSPLVVQTEEQPAVPSTSGQAPPPYPAPAFGSMSIAGRSREMEDAISLQPYFFRPEVPGRRPLHFFAVFDGHGGSHVAKLCEERMHVLLGEELERAGDSSVCEVEGWKRVMERCFGRMDGVALSSCPCGNVGVPCDCENGGVNSEIVGSTAIVAVVSSTNIIVANCGDSRAVLSRGGRAIPLSTDHKPDRPDELERIEAAGGRVIYLNGARVLGILAMSRALGDKYLKPIVISDPEVNMTERSPEDECLILASDGLWDVLSNDMACDVARQCLNEGSQPSSTATVVVDVGEEEATDKEMQASQLRCSTAAALLTRLALGRKSSDNISVIVIDLKRG